MNFGGKICPLLVSQDQKNMLQDTSHVPQTRWKHNEQSEVPITPLPNSPSAMQIRPALVDFTEK